MNSQFKILFKGPGINQISNPTKIVSPLVKTRIQALESINLLKVIVVVVFVGGGLYIGYRYLNKKTEQKVKNS